MSIMFTSQVSSLNAHQILGGRIGKSGSGSEHRPSQSGAEEHAPRTQTPDITAIRSQEASELKQVLHRLRTYVPAENAVAHAAPAAVFGSTSEIGRLVEYLSTVAAVVAPGASVAEVTAAEAAAEAEAAGAVSAGALGEPTLGQLMANVPLGADGDHMAAMADAVNAALTAAADASARGDVASAHATLSHTAAAVGAMTSRVAGATSAQQVAATAHDQIVSGGDTAVAAQANSAAPAVLSLMS